MIIFFILYFIVLRRRLSQLTPVNLDLFIYMMFWSHIYLIFRVCILVYIALLVCTKTVLEFYTRYKTFYLPLNIYTHYVYLYRCIIKFSIDYKYNLNSNVVSFMTIYKKRGLKVEDLIFLAWISTIWNFHLSIHLEFMHEWNIKTL